MVYARLSNDKKKLVHSPRIQLLEGPSRGYDDFAILYRTNAQSRLFEDALRQARIPYQILSGFSFYERKETKDMISYMRLVANPRDEMAFIRVINEPKRGIGEKTVEKLRALAGVRGQSLLDVISDDEVVEGLPAKARDSVKQMAEIINLCRDEQSNLTISDIYDMLIQGYMKSLEEQVEAEGDREFADFKSFILILKARESVRRRGDPAGFWRSGHRRRLIK
ncbi:MAG: 3'-5' exonuclease [Anaerovoracaceae bacterium]